MCTLLQLYPAAMMKLEDINCVADLDGWSAEMLQELHGRDGELYHYDYCVGIWDNARGLATALGRSDFCEPYNAPMERPTWCIDYDTLQKEYRNQLTKRLAALRKNIAIDRTADSKTDNGKNNSSPVAENGDVNKLILLESRNKDPKRNVTEIARELAKGNEKYAQTLMRERRRVLKRRTADN
jgi:hypothetical protein